MTRLLPAIPAALAALLGLLAVTGVGHSQRKAKEEPPLPERTVVIDVDSPERALYRIAVPNLLGSGSLGPQAATVLRNDFNLVSLFDVLEPRSFIADLDKEGLGITEDPWSAVGAQGVIKGRIQGTGQVQVEMRLYELARGTNATLSRTYRGSSGDIRGFMHDFANRVLEQLTGKAGSFGTRIAFARRQGPGKKDVYVADFDGHNVGRVSKGGGISMLPAFGPGGIWFSRLTERGMYITHTGAKGRPVITGDGLNMGVTHCNGRVYFSSTRDGNSEIYAANPDGSGVQRLTKHPAIDVSPTCGPGGRIAFVSNRHGSPQIFTMGGDGSGVKRVTFRGDHNQTPSWCTDPDKPLIAFTGMSGGTDVFTVNLKTQEYTRLTQGQGANKDPAFSPDCRMVAFHSSRGGIFISSPEGLNHNRVVSGHAETLRWSR
jgi:TolB protein